MFILAELPILGGLFHMVAWLLPQGLRPLVGSSATLAVSREPVTHQPVHVEIIRRFLRAALPARNMGLDLTVVCTDCSTIGLRKVPS